VCANETRTHACGQGFPGVRDPCHDSAPVCGTACANETRTHACGQGFPGVRDPCHDSAPVCGTAGCSRLEAKECSTPFGITDLFAGSTGLRDLEVGSAQRLSASLILGRRTIVQARSSGPPYVDLDFDHLGMVPVARVLADPERFIGETLASGRHRTVGQACTSSRVV
jgi:hypothetical protein